MLIDKKKQLLQTLEYLLTEIKNENLDENVINDLWDVFYGKPDKDHTKYLFTGWWIYLMNTLSTCNESATGKD